VLNNGNTDLNLATLPGGGIPLLGTFAQSTLRELTGRTTNLSVQDGKLVGTVPARTLLMVTGTAGTGAGTTVNAALPDVTALTATPGDGAVGLSWTAATSADVTGYRVYQRANGGEERLLNFAPLPATTRSSVARSLTNGTAYTFRVVGVDAQGRESKGTTVSSTPSTASTVKVTFTVDARTQGNSTIELRRFDTGGQISYPMTQTARGIWKTDIDLPLYREVKFKFGNSSGGVKNSGYEAPGQSDRSLTVTPGATYTGTYDYISRPVPTTTVEGRVTGGGTPLAGALVEGNDPAFDYAYTFADGTYTALTSGQQTLKASAAAYTTSAPRTATAPATGIDFDLSRDLRTRYTIDGNLSDWTSPKLKLSSPDAGVFGADNNWLTLQADSDDTYLYLAYTYRVSGNSALLYLDTRTGGAMKADTFDAWPRAANLAGGADYFIARYENQAAQLRRIDSDTATTELPAAGYLQASSGTLPEQSFEVAIPWTSLGFSGRPTTPIRLYGGVFGGDNYGAGDIIPDAGSTPPGANTIGSDADKRRANFTEGLTFTP